MNKESFAHIEITPEQEEKINLIASQFRLSQSEVLAAIDALKNCMKAFQELNSLDWEQIKNSMQKITFEIKKYHVNEDFNLNKKIYLVQGPVGVNPASRQYKRKRFN